MSQHRFRRNSSWTHQMNNFCIAFHRNLSSSVETSGRNRFKPCSKVWLSQRRLSQNSHFLNKLKKKLHAAFHENPANGFAAYNRSWTDRSGFHIKRSFFFLNSKQRLTTKKNPFVWHFHAPTANKQSQPMAYFTQKPSCTIKGQFNTQGFVRNPSWPNRIIIPVFA